MTLTLPQNHRDQGFQRHISRLERAEQLHGRDTPAWQAVLNEPWITDHPFRGSDVESHCPHGHVDAHPIGWPHENHAGSEHARRQCTVCGSEWLEPVR